MPTYSIDTASRLVSVRFRDDLAFSNIVNYVVRLRSDSQFDPAFAELVDLRDVKAVSLSTRDLVQLADRVDPFSLKSRRAFVIRSQAQARTAKLHRILRLGGTNVRIFTSMEEARNWILAAAGRLTNAAAQK